ncbi:MAG: 50S ribosomal protein L25/general stress protein Ctc [Gammaproteobacteria bacterium]
MNEFELIAEPREDIGKGASRRLRRDGKLPGIVYGTNKDASMIVFNHNEVMHHLEQEAFYSRVLTLKIGKNKEKVVLKDLQRHPFKSTLLHIDLQRVDEEQTLTMKIPLHFINEDKCVGVKQDGGVISHVITEVEIACLPKDLPEYIEVDMLEIVLNQTIHLSDIQLPDGVQISSLLHGGDDTQPVASVHIPKVSAADEAADEAESAEVDTEDGESPEASDDAAGEPVKDDSESQDSGS